MYKNLLEVIKKELSLENFLNTAREIYRYERQFSFSNFHKSARYCRDQLKKHSASEVEMIPIPCDGETVFMDQIMPQAWDVSDATLEIVEPLDASEKILANYREEPHCIGIWSPPTAKGGIEAEVVLEEELISGKDIRGKAVLSSYDHHPRKIKAMVIQRGGLGIISDYGPYRKDMPDSTLWINYWTENTGWLPTKKEKNIFCFSITPRKGDILRTLLNNGRRVKVKALIKSSIYNGTINTITGIIPGSAKKNKEILILSHLYEPQASDNATGGASLIEILRVLTKLIKSGMLAAPKWRIRFLMGYELYGFSAFFQERETIRKNTLAAINMDSFSFDHRLSEITMGLKMNYPSQPFFGDLLLQDMAEYYFRKEAPMYPWSTVKGSFDDDAFIADRTIGIPVNWFYQSEGKYWHSSLNTFDKLDIQASLNIMTVAAAYIYFLASAESKEISWLLNKTTDRSKELILQGKRIAFITNLQRERILSISRLTDNDKITKEISLRSEEIRKFGKTEVDKVGIGIKKERHKLSRKEVAAKNMIPYRKTVGIIHCLAKVPFIERVEKPEGALETLSWMDGRKTLLKIMELVSLERGAIPDDYLMTDLMRYLRLLAKYGYIGIKYSVELDKEVIKKSLSEIGLKKRDIVFVHSSLSALGYIKGGADTVIDAFLETLGPDGTLLMANHPAPFTIIEDGLGKCSRQGKQPFNPKTTPSSVGKIADSFWRKKGVMRSLHPSHSVAGIGPLAKEMLSGHSLTSKPFSRESPFGKMLDYNGYFLFFGAEMTSATFFHALEEWHNLPYLQEGKVLVDCNGREKKVTINGLPSGHRDFYTLPNKIMSRLKKKKTDIKIKKVGLGRIKMVKAKELYEKLSEIIDEEPDIFLCDNKECDFCSKWRRSLV